MKRTLTISSVQALLSFFGDACVAQIPSPIATPVTVPSAPDGFLYNYQTLIGALLALAVGVPTILLLWRQLRQQYELKIEAALSLCRMFYEEALIYTRFFVNIDAGFHKAIKDRTLDPKNLKWPDPIVFASQATRLSELQPAVALALMYFYQALTHFQQLSQKLSVGLSDNEIRALTDAYQLTATQLENAMRVMNNELAAHSLGTSAQDKALLHALAQIVKR